MYVHFYYFAIFTYGIIHLSFVSNALAFDSFEDEASNEQMLFYIFFFIVYRKIKILKIYILIIYFNYIIRNSDKLSLKI